MCDYPFLEPEPNVYQDQLFTDIPADEDGPHDHNETMIAHTKRVAELCRIFKPVLKISQS